MSEQLSIFDTQHEAQAGPPREIRELARCEDLETSHLAAARVDEFLAHHQALITEALKQGPGHIYDIADRTGGELDQVQVARRLDAMFNVERTGEKRNGPKGRPCAVWRLK